MSVPTPAKAPTDATSERRAVGLAIQKNAPLSVVKELLTNTGILQVNGNFDFADFVANIPSPLPMWTGGCRFRVPPAPPADGEPKPAPALTLSLDKEDMDLSSVCPDYIGFRWPESVEVFAAAHPFDDMPAAELSQDPQEQRPPSISNPALAFPIPTAPGQLVLNLEFGKSYFLSVDPKYVNASDPTIPAETPELELKSDIAPGAHKLPLVGIFTSHAVPFTSGVGQVPGWSQYDSDRTDRWGAIPYWWFAEQNLSQWERPCMFLPALRLLPAVSVSLPGLKVDTPASRADSFNCDVSFSFTEPDVTNIFAEYHLVQMSCRVVIVRSDEIGPITNVTVDCVDCGSDVKVTFSAYNVSPDTYEDNAAVTVTPQLDGSSLTALYSGNFCCRYVRIRVTITSPPQGSGDYYVLLRDVKFFGENLWKQGDWIGPAVERALTICRSDASLGFRRSHDVEFTWLSFGHLFDRVKALQRLFAHYDKEGISVLAPCVNCVDLIAAKLACYTTGNTIIPMASPISTKILEHVLNQTRPAVVLFDFAFAKRVCAFVLKGEYVLPSFVKHWLYCIPENTERGTEAFATDITVPFQLLSDCPLISPSNPPHPELAFKDTAHRQCFIFYTSGSTGLPKGVPRSFHGMEEYMNAYSDAVGSNHLAAMPLSHMSEGTSFLVSLLRGNRIALPTLRYSDAAGLTIIDQFSDLLRLQPTYLSSVPRFFEIVQRMFFDDVAALTAEGMDLSLARTTVTAQYRNGKLFGKQLRGMFWGSAPISSQLENFLRELWGSPHGPLVMSQGYGSSECGTITGDQVVAPNVVALLVETADSGHPLESYKGEVVVHTLTISDSYLNAPDNPSFISNIDLHLQGPLFTESWSQTLAASPLLAGSSNINRARFFCTGDLAESSPDPPAAEVQRAVAKNQAPAKPSQIVTLDSSWGRYSGHRAILVPPGCKLNVIGRLKNVVKLPNGEFVAPEYIEGCLAKADIVEQICVITRSTHSFVVAIIVPKDLTLSSRENSMAILTRALVSAAGELALPAYMIPRQIYIATERWSAANGMMTHNEKLNRAGVFQHYAAVIDELFAAGELAAPDKGHLDSGNSAESDITIASVIRAIQSVSKTAMSVVATTDISSPEVLGGDSLTIMLLISKLNSTFHLKLSPSILFELKTVEDLVNCMVKSKHSSSALSHATSSTLLQDLFDHPLSQFLSQAASGCSEAVVSAAVSAANAPANTYFQGSSVAADISQLNDIFLSGATGFIGSHILQDLIENSNANIHCLVRASSASQPASARLDYCLSKYNIILTDTQRQRVIVHNGDLSKPLFGLPQDQFLLLSERLDAIVHNGAHVNWLMTYAQLRATNVLGTATALHLALIGKRKQFVYVSTLSVSSMAGDESAPLSPQHCLSPGNGGYMPSKFIAERLVRAANIIGLPVTIIRPGIVVGHTKTGAAHTTDYAAAIIAAFARMREYVAADGHFDLSPVDMVARATVLLSLQSSSKDLRVFHLVDAGRVRVREVGQVAAGQEGRGLSVAEFRASMTKRLGSGVAANGAESLRSLGSFLDNDSFFTMEQSYRSEATVASLRQLGLDWQCDATACVRGIVAFLEQSTAQEESNQ